MIYREVGQYKTSYPADQAIFPITNDRIGIMLILLVAYIVPPLSGSQYLMGPILTQLLVFGLAALGLNLLTGYAGQVSLGTGGFMAVGAFGCYNLVLRLPEIPLIFDFILAGLMAAAVGILFGIPSLRIKGFYLAVATLASQFFLLWIFDHVGWFTNYDPAGVASAPTSTLFGKLAEEGEMFGFLSPINVIVSGPNATPEAKYLLTLTVVIILALLAKNIVRGMTGRAWMAIRDFDIAAEIIGIRPLRTKLVAFAVSSFYCGVAGAMYVFYLCRKRRYGSIRPDSFIHDSVHDYHWWSWFHHGVVSRGSVYCSAAAVLEYIGFAFGRRHAVGRDARQSGADRLRGDDRVFPRGRAARICAHVADREGKTASVALPVLSLRRWTDVKNRMSVCGIAVIIYL